MDDFYHATKTCLLEVFVEELYTQELYHKSYSTWIYWSSSSFVLLFGWKHWKYLSAKGELFNISPINVHVCTQGNDLKISVRKK